MNPTFRHVDFANCGPGITRLEQVTVRVWVHGARMERWRQLLEVEVDLRTIQYLGKSVCCHFLFCSCHGKLVLKVISLTPSRSLYPRTQ